MTFPALILMSTYQGEAYLAEQLDSIIKQDLKNWTLLIRDDGSTDGTVEIINRYTEHDSRIKHIKDSLGNVKPAQSFSILMGHALQRQENFIFFADQDDVWLPNKLQLSVTALAKEEVPTLIFSDLCVVNKNLQVINPSYLDYEKLTPKKSSPLNTLLIHNYITGCTVGINRALLKLAYPVPENAVMHDWWCALSAAAAGKIKYLEQATVLYRQHSRNDRGSRGFYAKFRKWQSIKKIKTHFHERFKQAKDLLPRIHQTNPNWETINLFCSLPQRNRISRLTQLHRLNLKPDGKMRTIGLYFFVLFNKV